MSRSKRHDQVLIVAGGGNSVGRSSITFNLAVRLAARGESVTLLDADPRPQIAPTAAPPAKLSNAVAPTPPTALPAAQRLTLADYLPATTPPSAAWPANVQLAPPPGNNAPAARRLACAVADHAQRIRALRRTAGLVLVDNSHTDPHAAAQLAAAGDRLLLVVTPDPHVLTNAYAILKLAHANGLRARAGIIVNKARSAIEATEFAERLQRVAARFLTRELDYLSHLLVEQSIASASRARRPFVLQFPRSNAAVAIDRLAQRLRPHTQTTPAGVWYQLASLFF